MKRISYLARFLSELLLLFLVAFSFVENAFAAAPTTFRQPHPISWMHSSPTGEVPGWDQKFWFQYETSVANIWNAPLRMTDKVTGKEYRYFADYEQFTTIMQIGGAITDRLGVTLEVPYANRSGGFLDNIIDDFHVMIGNRRFNRQFYDEGQQDFSIKTDGVEYLNSGRPVRATSNVNLKLKYWAVKSRQAAKGQCPCGISFGYQLKQPVENPRNGGTTGEQDHSALLYFGFPFLRASSVWGTAAYTWLGENPAMKDWPRYDYLQMYELNFDLGLGTNFGLILHARAESPILKVDRLNYEDTSTDPLIISRNRAGSGWNSLVRWRGTDAIGLRYRTQSGNQWQVLFVEDWGMGSYDSSDNVYSNNAPDVNLVFQGRIEF